MNKYNNACVYKIYNKLNPEEFYIGSTIQSLTRRFLHHKRSDMKLKSKLYKLMKENEFDNFDIELLCCYEDCENKTQLRKLEQEFIDELKPSINKYRAYCSEEKIKEQLVIYYENNKEKIKLNQKTKILCECGKETTKTNKLRHEKSNFHQDFINNQ